MVPVKFGLILQFYRCIGIASRQPLIASRFSIEIPHIKRY
jgi:hypothetical protein